MANGTQTVSAVITADAKPFKRSVEDAGRSFSVFSKAAAAFGAVAAAAFIGASVAASKFLTSAVNAAIESERIGRGLENAAENAGVFATQAEGISGATQALKDYATELSKTIGVDDEKILSIVTQWLAVPQLASLGVDGLNNLVKVAADVAAGTNKDLDTIALAFVKVAGDGETALNKLLRAGIVFTDAQKQQYQALLDANNEIGAQSFLIETLGTKYAGAAEAIADPWARLRQIFEDFQEQVGVKFIPVLEATIPIIQAFLDDLIEDPEFIRFVEELAKSFGELLPKLLELLPELVKLGKDLLPLLVDLLPTITQLIRDLSPVILLAAAAIGDLTKYWSNLIGVGKYVADIFDAIRRVLTNGTSAGREFQNIVQNLNGPLAILAQAAFLAGQQIANLINWWNSLWGVQQSRPIIGVGSPDSIDRGLNIRTVGFNAFPASTVNISVNAVAPSAEVGRAVVQAIQDYERVGGTR